MTITAEALDLDMLAADVGKMLSRYSYDLDISEDAIRAALPAFIETATAHDLALDDEPGSDAASWAADDDEPEPTLKSGRGRAPKMTYVAWWRSQTVELGAVTRDEWYWRCPKQGCHIWSGPYEDGLQAKQPGMDHVHYEHDLPAARAAEQRRQERKEARRQTRGY